MATTHHSPLAEGQYEIYDLPTTLTLWAAATVNLQTSSTLVDGAMAHGMCHSTCTEKSKIMTQQHKRHQCRYWHEWPEVRGGGS